MPNLVPDFITSAFVDNDSEIIGVNILLQAMLIIYMVVGYILFLGGLFMALVTHKHNSP